MDRLGQTDALGNISTFTYGADNNKLTQKVTRAKADGSKESLTTQYFYDGNNRLIKTINPDGSTTQTVGKVARRHWRSSVHRRSNRFAASGR